jgi:hypothetical protein
MRLPRRQFLRTGMISVVSAGLALTAAPKVFGQKKKRGKVRIPLERSVDLPLEAQYDPVFLFKAETFRPYLGGIFTAPNALGQEIELELTDVSTYRPFNASQITKRAIATDSFNLTFKAAAELSPLTTIHTINHPSLGQFDLFLTMGKNDNADLFYEAVINHLS